MSNTPEDDDLVPFSDLPPDIQDIVKKGITEPQEWVSFSSAQMNVVKDPGRRLRYLRLEREWTLEELAAKAQVELNHVLIAEDDFGKSRIENLEKIATALGTTVNELLFKRS